MEKVTATVKSYGGYVATTDLLDLTGVNTQVTVTVEGGYLAGLCNANPTGEENYAADTCATFQGAALAVVRAAAPGTMTVTVSAEGYAPATVTLEVTA